MYSALILRLDKKNTTLVCIFEKLAQLGYPAFVSYQKEKADIPMKVYLLLLLDKVFAIFILFNI